MMKSTVGNLCRKEGINIESSMTKILRMKLSTIFIVSLRENAKYLSLNGLIDIKILSKPMLNGLT